MKFLNDLLQIDPDKRISISQLESHPYLTRPFETFKPFIGNTQEHEKDIVFKTDEHLVFNIKDPKYYNQFLETLKS